MSTRKKAVRKTSCRKKGCCCQKTALTGIQNAETEDESLGNVTAHLNQVARESNRRINVLLDAIDTTMRHFEESTEVIRTELSERYDSLEGIRRDSEGEIEEVLEAIDARRAKLLSEKIV
jgi:hypothetical protein